MTHWEGNDVLFAAHTLHEQKKKNNYEQELNKAKKKKLENTINIETEHVYFGAIWSSFLHALTISLRGYYLCVRCVCVLYIFST